VELVRTHHPLGAIGELASPMDAQSPSATTVIVGEGAVDESRAMAYVAALRRVDPAVRVLVISSRHMPMYDGSLPPDVTPDSLRRLIHGASSTQTDARDPGNIGLSPEGDEEAVLEALLSGRGSTGPTAEVVAPAGHTSPATQGDQESLEEEQSYRGPRGRDVPPPLPEWASERPAAASASSDAVPTEPHKPERLPSAEASVGGVDAASIAAPISSLDCGPMQAMLSGQSPLDAALARIRAASGLTDLEYTRHVAPLGGETHNGEDSLSAMPGGPHVKVIHHGGVLGYLTSASQSHAFNRLTPEHLRYFSLWAALGEHDAQLREFAFTDELTGAYNRRFFNRFMEGALDQARASRHYLTILYFDLDDFKLYNDRFGHAAGDEILTSVVSLLKSTIRPSDKVCRLGGDEFAVIFYDPTPSPARPGADEQQDPLRDSRAGGAPQSISQIAERFQRQICQHRFPKLGELAPGTLTISGGMATFPWDGRDAPELLARADELLMQSKAQGKNLITLGPGAEQACRVINEA
jgi:GGDEF domain-containing protein